MTFPRLARAARVCWLPWVLVLTGVACGSDSNPADGDTPDGRVQEGQGHDAGSLDAGEPGAGMDASMPTVTPTKPTKPTMPQMDGSLPRDAGVDATVSALPPTEVANVSGSRLKRKVYRAPGGAQVFKAIWDELLDHECRFLPASDHAFRCLPVMRQRVYFADAECSQPVHLPSDGCTFEYVYDRTLGSECGALSDYTVYAVTDEAASVSGDYHVMGSGGCRAVGPADGLSFFKVTPVAPDRFVAAERVTSARDHGMSARFYAGEDGSFFFDGLQDDERGGAACFASEGLCIPQGGISLTAAGALFADDACSEPVAVSPDGLCPPTVAIDTQYTQVGECTTSSRRLLAIGDEVDVATVYRLNGSTCELAGSVPGPAFRTADEIALEGLPPVEEQLDGSGVLQARRLVDSSGRSLGNPDALLVSETGRECGIVEFQSGEHACAPEGSKLESPSDLTSYGQNDCSGEPLIHGWHGCDPAQPAFQLILANSTWCEPTLVQAIYPVVGPYGGTSYWWQQEASCDEVVLDADFAPIFTRGPAGSPALLPALSIELD